MHKGGSALCQLRLLIIVLRDTQQVHIWRPNSVMTLTVLILTLLATLTHIAHSQTSDPSECELILFNCPGGLGDPSKSSSPLSNNRDI